MMANNRLLNGRQLAFMIFQSYKRIVVEVGMTEFRDQQNIRIKGDNLAAFVTDWDDCIFGVCHEPSPEIKESIFTDKVWQCAHFEQAYQLYVTKCTHDGLERSYNTLGQYVIAHLERRRQKKIAAEIEKANASASAGTGKSMVFGCHLNSSIAPSVGSVALSVQNQPCYLAAHLPQIHVNSLTCQANYMTAS